MLDIRLDTPTTNEKKTKGTTKSLSKDKKIFPIESIKLEKNPSMLMIIGDCLSQNFDEENTSLIFKDSGFKIKEAK